MAMPPKDQFGEHVRPVRVVDLANGSGLTKTVVTMDGTSKQLVPADPNRSVVKVFSVATNASAAVDETGGTVALDTGTPLEPGGGYEWTGTAAQAAMTAIGTTGNKLIVYRG